MISKDRKGITPVIAIVLLLMVTVGAVGVVYTQFQSLVGNPAQVVGDQQEIRNTELGYSSVYRDSSDNLKVYVKNTGSVAWNISDFKMQFVPKARGTAVNWVVASQELSGTQSDFNCFNEADSYQVVQPGETYKCDTGFEFPRSTQSVGIQIEMRGADRSWGYTCSPTTASAYGC